MSLREAQEAGLREHNRLRALHQDTEPLELSNDLCNEAQVLSWFLDIQKLWISRHGLINWCLKVVSIMLQGAREMVLVKTWQVQLECPQQWWKKLYGQLNRGTMNSITLVMISTIQAGMRIQVPAISHRFETKEIYISLIHMVNHKQPCLIQGCVERDETAGSGDSSARPKIHRCWTISTCR